MADILLQLPVWAPISRVFDAMSTPSGLNAWWTLDCRGERAVGARYAFDFGPGYAWEGTLTRCESDVACEWRMDVADDDWTGTHVGFTLAAIEHGVRVEFAHRGWRDANAHFRGSAYCWATYLRLLKRFVEHGEMVPYGARDRA